MNIGERLQGFGYSAAWRIVRTLPEGAATSLFTAAADRAAKRGGPGTQRLRRNLARVVPEAGEAELDELVRAGLRSYARYWKEAFRLPSMDPQEICARMDPLVAGRENLDAALAKGNGAVVALSHSGN